MTSPDTPLASAATVDLSGYRPCAGIMLVNAAGHVFAGHRIDNPGDAWQMPQGGIDEGEDPAVAALRELREETGTTAAEIIAETPGWMTYDLPAELAASLWKGKYRGQAQKWFLMRFTGTDADIAINTEIPEFDAWKWVPVEEIASFAVPFKRTVYDRVVAIFTPTIRQLFG